jgi:hypothetical protein
MGTAAARRKHHPAKGWRCHVRHNQQFRLSATAGDHHDALRTAAPTGHQFGTGTHRVQIRHSDQLTLISMISPSGLCKASMSWGSLPAIDAVCGHHAHQCRRPGGWLGRSARDGPSAATVNPFRLMSLWRPEHSPRADLRTWGAPLPLLRYRLKKQTQAPGGEKINWKNP